MRILKICLAVAAAFAATQAGAAITYNDSVTNNVIMGTGIANGGFTIDTNTTGSRAQAVEVGLRARVRYDLASDQPTNDFNSNGDGTYSHAAGSPAAAPTRARWNFDWSANSDINNDTATGQKLSAFTWRLGMDTDASATAVYAVIDLLSLPFDHSFGNNGTAQSAGAEGNSFALATTNNLMQNSWNLDFFDNGVLFPGVFNPAANGEYSFFLEASNQAGAVLARTDITVIVGDGAAQIPEPGSLALVGLGLLGAFAARRRMR